MTQNEHVDKQANLEQNSFSYSFFLNSDLISLQTKCSRSLLIIAIDLVTKVTTGKQFIEDN